MQAAKVMEEARETLGQYADRPVQMVREHPFPAALTLFGIGLGVGLLLTSRACDALMHEETTTERLSRQFNDAMSEIKGAIQRGFSAVGR